MNLPQMVALANAKSSYSRPEGEIYAALDEAGFLVYSAVLKEFSGFFLKFDTSTVTIVPGVMEYLLPPDVTQLVHVGERQNISYEFAPCAPETIGKALENTQVGIGWDDWAWMYGEQSTFSYAGPYLDAPAAITGVQTQKIRFSPSPVDTRMVQLVYTAKWLPINDASSKVMLPDEGTHAMVNFAIAELLRSNNDTLSAEYESKATKHQTAFLTWVRNRQIQQSPQITPYMG
jgi:hypothetical protein